MAGITSFEFVPKLSQITAESDQKAITVLVGSYDEFLRIYRLHYSWTDGDNDEEQNQECKLPLIDSTTSTMLYKIHIDGGGIWRMKMFDSTISLAGDLLVLISAMYSGAYLLSFSSDLICEENFGKCRTKCKEIKQLILPTDSKPSTDSDQGKLIYGINSNIDLSTVLFSSYYEKELYLFRHKNVSS